MSLLHSEYDLTTVHKMLRFSAQLLLADVTDNADRYVRPKYVSAATRHLHMIMDVRLTVPILRLATTQLSNLCITTAFANTDNVTSPPARPPISASTPPHPILASPGAELVGISAPAATPHHSSTHINLQRDQKKP